MAGRAEADEFVSFVAERGVSSFEHIADGDGSVWAEFGVRSQPAFVFINDDGTVENHQGRLGLESLTDRVNSLIAS